MPTRIRLQGVQPSEALLRAFAAIPKMALAWSVSSGCTLIVDPNLVQCREDADCSEFEGTVCTSDQVCGRESCVTHRDCVARFDEPAICRSSDSTCTALLTEDCLDVFPEEVLLQDEVLMLGFMAPLRDTFGSYGAPLAQGAELALDEIERRANGLPGESGAARRHLGVLMCHDTDDSERVARHLVDNVQVPAILGPAFSGVTIRVTTDVTTPAEVLVVSPSATSPDLTELPDRGLVWRTVPSDAIQASPLALLVPATEAALQAAGLAETESARVAMTVKRDSWGLGISAEVYEKMYDLGLAVEDASVFRRFEHPDPATDPMDEFAEIAQEIVAFQPHIVIGLGTNEWVTRLLPEIERQWTPAVERPRYLLPEGARVDELKAAVTELGLSARTLGTAPGARRSQRYAGFASSFAGYFGEAPGNLAEFAYDAVYLTAYAIAVAGSQAPSGRQMADALTGLSCKDGPDLIPAGADGFAGYFETAQTSGCIDFDGVSGPLDFDNATGEAPSDIALWCPVANGGSVTFDPLDVFYDVTVGSLSAGEVAFCP